MAMTAVLIAVDARPVSVQSQFQQPVEHSRLGIRTSTIFVRLDAPATSTAASIRWLTWAVSGVVGDGRRGLCPAPAAGVSSG